MIVIHQVSKVLSVIVVNMAKVSPRLFFFPKEYMLLTARLCYVTGEYLKNLFATPFGSRSSKVEIATGIAINETSSQYKHSCHEYENS